MTQTPVAEPAPETALPLVPQSEPEAPEKAASEPGGEPSEGEPGSQAKTAPPWASIADPYELIRHDSLRDVLAERDQFTESTLREQFKGQYDQAVKGLEASKLVETVNTQIGRLAKLAQDSGDESPQMERILDRLEELVKPHSELLAESAKSGVKREGRDEVLTSLNQVNLGKAGDDLRRRSEYVKLLGKPGANIQDAMDFYAETAWGPKVAAAQKERDEAKLEAEDLKAQLRAKGGGPNLAPSSPGGSGELEKKIQEGSASLADIREAKKRGLLDY